MRIGHGIGIDPFWRVHLFYRGIRYGVRASLDDKVVGRGTYGSFPVELDVALYLLPTEIKQIFGEYRAIAQVDLFGAGAGTAAHRAGQRNRIHTGVNTRDGVVGQGIPGRDGAVGVQPGIAVERAARDGERSVATGAASPDGRHSGQGQCIDGNVARIAVVARVGHLKGVRSCRQTREYRARLNGSSGRPGDDLVLIGRNAVGAVRQQCHIPGSSAKGYGGRRAKRRVCISRNDDRVIRNIAVQGAHSIEGSQPIVI